MDDNKKNVAIAQINTNSGDIEYNANKILRAIKHAQELNLQLVIFPELALVGYGLKDTINRHPIIVKENLKWLQELFAAVPALWK